MAEPRYSVSTRNGYAPLSSEMAPNHKRKRNNTEQSDKSVSDFMSSTSEDKLNRIFQELRLIRSNQDTTNSGMLTFQNNFLHMNKKLDEVIEVTNRNTDLLQTLAYKSIDQEARSRRNNLIFWGMAENYQENCFSIVRDFIKNHLDLDADRMYIARSHRLGPRKIGYRNPKRPIITNFRDFCDVESIISRSYMLRNTQFSVCYDLPKEINEARKGLWQELKSVKARQPRVKCQIVFPAKLIVDGKVYRDEFPGWNDIVHRDRLVDFTHIDRAQCVYDQPPVDVMNTTQQSRLHSFNFTSTQENDHELNNGTIPAVSLSTSRSCDNFSNNEQDMATITETTDRVTDEVSVQSAANYTEAGSVISTSRPVSSDRGVDMETEGLFRPYDLCLANTNCASQSDEILNTQSKTKQSVSATTQNRTSRSLFRTGRRSPSKSVPRAKSQQEIPSSINRQQTPTASSNRGSRESVPINPVSKNKSRSDPDMNTHC